MLLKEKKPRFKEMLENGEMVFAPCVWDCYSAKAAEICGFRQFSCRNSGGGTTGTPDIALMGADELLYLTDRIATFSPLPVIVDFDEGYGDNDQHLQEHHKAGKGRSIGLYSMTEWNQRLGKTLLQNRERPGL